MKNQTPDANSPQEINTERELSSLFSRADHCVGEVETAISILNDAYNLAEKTGRENIKSQVVTRLSDAFEVRVSGNVELRRRNTIK